MNNKDLRKRAYWDKRLILVIEGALALIFAILFYYGIKTRNDIISGVFSNAFTGLLVTFVATLVGFNTESEAEKRIRENEEHILSMHKELDTLSMLLKEGIADVEKATNGLKGKSCAFCSSQISDIKPNRSECNLYDLISKAESEICIFTINLRSFVPYLSELQKAAQRGVSVRISAMHPAFAKQYNAIRYINGDPPEKRWEDMKGAIVQFASAERYLSKKNFIVRAYTDIAPTLVMVVVDNICCTSYLLNGKHSSETIHFLFKKINDDETICPYTYLKSHYDSIWSDCRESDLSIEELLKLEYTVVSESGGKK